MRQAKLSKCQSVNNTGKACDSALPRAPESGESERKVKRSERRTRWKHPIVKVILKGPVKAIAALIVIVISHGQSGVGVLSALSQRPPRSPAGLAIGFAAWSD